MKIKNKKRILLSTMIIIFIGFYLYIFLEKKAICEYDYGKEASEGYEIIIDNKDEKNITVTYSTGHTLGTFEQKIYFNENKEIIKIKEIKIIFDKPPYFDDYQVKEKNIKEYNFKGDDILSDMVNFEQLKNLQSALKKSCIIK